MVSFKPVKDISGYLDPSGKFTEEGAKRMLEDTSREFEQYGQNREIANGSYQRIADKTDEILSRNEPKSYPLIATITNSPGYDSLRSEFYDLEAFKSSFSIYSIEKEYGITPTVYDLSESIEDYADLRQSALYLFRRIQLFWPDGDCEPLFEALIERGVSFFFLLQMLKELDLGDKYCIGQRISLLYSSLGKERESQLFAGLTSQTFEKNPESDEAEGTLYRHTQTIGYQRTDDIPDADHRICFISCVNDEKMYEECLYYISRLIVPDGYHVDTVAVRGAKSMTSGYNAAMKSSDAKFKIYIHQDVCILNPFFLTEIVNIFSRNEDIGMIGLVGNPALPPDAVVWHGWRKGNMYDIYPDDIRFTEKSLESNPVAVENVEAIDGFLMATDRDIRWRDDLFDGWDYYDVSEAAEFLKAGLRVVVPDQTKAWAAHDDGNMNLSRYDRYRRIFLENYGR